MCIFKIDKNSGDRIKKFDFEGYNFDSASAPYIENGVGYFTSANKGVTAITLTDAKLIWNFETKEALAFTSPYTSKGSKSVDSSVVPYKDGLLFGASDGYVYLVEKDGSLRESFYIGSPVISKLAVSGDKVYALDFSGRLTAFEIG